MVKLVKVVLQHAAAFMARFGNKALPGQQRALERIAVCRTHEAGTIHYHCQKCDAIEARAASCGHRSCSQCGQHKAVEWEQKQQAKLLPVPYYMVTFTVPSQLRPFFYQHQRTAYDLFFTTSSGTLSEIARDPRHLGGELGFSGVLHTWKRDLGYHVHIHYLVPGGALGIAPKTATTAPPVWITPKKPGYLLPAPVLATVMRNRFRDQLRRDHPDLWRALPAGVWKPTWNVNIQAVGSGAKAFGYLARYVQKTAIDANRIIASDAKTVTYTWIDRQTKQRKTAKVPGEVFLQRFIQHVLPRGLVRVRHYGFLGGAAKNKLAQARTALGVAPPDPMQPAADPEPSQKACCEKCQRELKFIAFEAPSRTTRKRSLLEIIAARKQIHRPRPPAPEPPEVSGQSPREYQLKQKRSARPPPSLRAPAPAKPCKIPPQPT